MPRARSCRGRRRPRHEDGASQSASSPTTGVVAAVALAAATAACTATGKPAVRPAWPCSPNEPAATSISPVGSGACSTTPAHATDSVFWWPADEIVRDDLTVGLGHGTRRRALRRPRTTERLGGLCRCSGPPPSPPPATRRVVVSLACQTLSRRRVGLSFGERSSPRAARPQRSAPCPSRGTSPTLGGRCASSKPSAGGAATAGDLLVTAEPDLEIGRVYRLSVTRSPRCSTHPAHARRPGAHRRRRLPAPRKESPHDRDHHHTPRSSSVLRTEIRQVKDSLPLDVATDALLHDRPGARLARLRRVRRSGRGGVSPLRRRRRVAGLTTLDRIADYVLSHR